MYTGALKSPVLFFEKSNQTTVVIWNTEKISRALFMLQA